MRSSRSAKLCLARMSILVLWQTGNIQPTTSERNPLMQLNGFQVRDMTDRRRRLGRCRELRVSAAADLRSSALHAAARGGLAQLVS